MKNKCIATENFSSGKRNFFLDFMIARNKTNYIKINKNRRKPGRQLYPQKRRHIPGRF